MSSAAVRGAVGEVAFAAAISWAQAAWACSCGGFWEPTDADVIFQGEAVEVHVPLHLRFGPERIEGVGGIAWGLWFEVARNFDDDVRTVFRVERAWKGNPAQFVTVNTGSGMCCNCTVGAILEEGSEYVVYAAKDDGETRVGWCAGYVVAGKDLPRPEVTSLGAGTPPSKARRGFPMFWRHLLLPATIAVVVALPVLIWRRRSKRR